jgi:hypothetical protein
MTAEEAMRPQPLKSGNQNHHCGCDFFLANLYLCTPLIDLG